MIAPIHSELEEPVVQLGESEDFVDWVTPVDTSSNRLTEILLTDSLLEASHHRRAILMVTERSTLIFEYIQGVCNDTPALLPLLFGVLIGFVVGRAWDKRQDLRLRAEAIISNSQFASIVLAMLWRVLNVISERRVWNEEKLGECVEATVRSTKGRIRENGVKVGSANGTAIPKHVAVIMDGNRRYGRTVHGSVAKGHLDGAKTLVDFADWCITEGIEVLTVYAFSTENWNRDPSEIASLMSLFCSYCEELLVEAKQRNIRLCVLSTETERIPQDVMEGLRRMTEETQHCVGGLTMNICLSYGGRGEIVNVCKQLASEVLDGTLEVDRISENDVRDRLLTHHCSDPDVVIRTSGEFRLSNFLLWQSAYSELFFIPKQWPQLQKEDFMSVIHSYAKGRRRRFGK